MEGFHIVILAFFLSHPTLLCCCAQWGEVLAPQRLSQLAESTLPETPARGPSVLEQRVTSI